jgi:hypothetical protein
MNLRPTATRWWSGATLVCAALCVQRLVATTVIAPTFAQLIAGAERVVVAEVVDVESRRVIESSGPTIVTEVSLRIERTLKGQARSIITLEFPGGTIGDETLEISGMPRFRIGDRDVLFIKGGRISLSPLVGFMHGRFRVTTDPATGTDYVSRYNFTPFTVEQLGADTPDAPPARQAMPLADFESRIARALGERRPQR